MKINLKSEDKVYELEMEEDAISFSCERYDRTYIHNLLWTVEKMFPDFVIGTMMVSSEPKIVQSMYGGKVRLFEQRVAIRWERNQK